MNRNERIFRKALASNNPDAIWRVAQAFEAIHRPYEAQLLFERANQLWSFAFGAMARGTPIAGTNGAVIPPGRYWLDLTDESHRKAWIDLTVDKPEITVEKEEWSGDTGGQHIVKTVIFSIPPTATNYGLPGIFFPTKVLGFPTLAGAADNPYAVHSKADTVQRPAPLTHADALAETPDILAEGLQRGTVYVAETAGKGAGAAAKGIGFSPTEWGLIGAGILVALYLLTQSSVPLRIIRHV